MQTYINILLLAVIVIYIVDLSGFTESWRSLVASLLGVKALKPLPPFDCSLCMTWWVCIIYTIVVGQFSLVTLAFIAMVSYLSIPIGQAMIFIRELTLSMINKISDYVNR